jgi:hypothetical protein
MREVLSARMLATAGNAHGREGIALWMISHEAKSLARARYFEV